MKYNEYFTWHNLQADNNFDNLSTITEAGAFVTSEKIAAASAKWSQWVEHFFILGPALT